MRELKENEIVEAAGGISIGVAVFGLIAGFLTGGPAGLGIAAAGMVGAKGVDNLVDLTSGEKK